MTGRYGRRRKVRWAERASCGCYVRSGHLHEQPAGSGRWVCESCRYTALGTAIPQRRPL